VAAAKGVGVTWVLPFFPLSVSRLRLATPIAAFYSLLSIVVSGQLLPFVSLPFGRRGGRAFLFYLFGRRIERVVAFCFLSWLWRWIRHYLLFFGSFGSFVGSSGESLSCRLGELMPFDSFPSARWDCWLPFE